MTSIIQDVPIFTLGTVLFPGGALPLKAFEQRYIDMTKECLRDERPFGVCLILEGREVGDAALPATVGCLARIETWDMPQMGLFHLLARGDQRFSIRSSRVATNGLVRADIETWGDEPATSPDEITSGVLKAILERVGTTHIAGEPRWSDATWVGYRLAELLPLDMPARQELLELRDPVERLARLQLSLVRHGLVS